MYSILCFDDRCVLCKWIGTGLNGFRCRLTIELGFGLFEYMLVVPDGFKTIRVDLHRFCTTWILICLLIWTDFIRFQGLSGLDWIRIDLGMFEFGWIRAQIRVDF